MKKIFIPQSSLGHPVFIFTLQNSYIYAQLTFVFQSLEITYIVRGHIDTTFLLPLLKHFNITHEHICAFCLFFQKDFGISGESFLIAFLCFFYNILLTFSYKGKTLFKNIFSVFLLYASKINFTIWVFFKFYLSEFSLLEFSSFFFIRMFFSRIFFIRIRRNYYVVNNILWHLLSFNNIFTFF